MLFIFTPPKQYNTTGEPPHQRAFRRRNVVIGTRSVVQKPNIRGREKRVMKCVQLSLACRYEGGDLKGDLNTSDLFLWTWVDNWKIGRAHV